MSEQLNPKTFDLVGVLSGRDYPTLDIDVYFEEALGFEIQRARETLRNLTLLGKDDEAKIVAESLEDLVRQTQQHKCTITLKSVPAKVNRDILKKVQADHPSDGAMFGIPVSNPEQDEAYTLAQWLVYSQVLTTPDGSTIVLDEEQVQAIWDHAPQAVHKQISDGIKELQSGGASGFEYAAKEIDFLSQASPEG